MDRIPRPHGAALRYGTFTRRRLAWIESGGADFWHPPARRRGRAPLRSEKPGAEGCQSEGAKDPAPIPISSGLAFLDIPGLALQVRRAALCVRFADGGERYFPARGHNIKFIIIVASASISTEALRWCAAENIALLIMHRKGECFSIISDGIAHKHARKELALRRRQFEAPRVKIAVTIVALKIRTLGLPRGDTKVFLAKLGKARTVQDALACEAEASGMYWRVRKGIQLAFKGTVPDGWRIFQSRVISRRGGRLGEKDAVFGARNATHPMNAMLNYGYAVSLGQMTRAIAGLGLDPCFGFLHSDKPGRLSLTYDALELIRSRMDEIVFRFAGERTFRREDFVPGEKQGSLRLSNSLAREIAARVLREIPFKDYVAIVRKIAGLF